MPFIQIQKYTVTETIEFYCYYSCTQLQLFTMVIDKHSFAVEIKSIYCTSQFALVELF